MRSLKIIFTLILLCSAVMLRGETFELADGRSVSGDPLISSATDLGLQIKTGEGTYEKFTWAEFAQGTLKQFAQQPKLAAFVEPFIEIPVEQRMKKTEVTIKPPPRLELPPKASLFGSLFSSSVGIFALFLIYAANIYAGYEVAVIRAYPPAMVCGLSAVLPIIGPVIFLCMATRMPKNFEEEAPEAPTSTIQTPASIAAAAAAVAAAEAGPEASSGLHFAVHKPNVPEPQIFQRGQYTFNRRFIETKFAGFFAAVRRAPDQDMQLFIKTTNQEYLVHRISQITANDLSVELHQAGAPSAATISFADIQEMKLKHKDA